MEENNSNFKNIMNSSTYQNDVVSFRCTYQVNDINNEIRLINNEDICSINPDILIKVKILNDNNEKQNLIFKKRFDSIGNHTLDYMVEGRLNNMSFMFNDYTSLKKVEFFSCDTSQVIDMNCMFRNCVELENLDLSNFNILNVMCKKIFYF